MAIDYNNGNNSITSCKSLLSTGGNSLSKLSSSITNDIFLFSASYGNGASSDQIVERLQTVLNNLSDDLEDLNTSMNRITKSMREIDNDICSNKKIDFE